MQFNEWIQEQGESFLQFSCMFKRQSERSCSDLRLFPCRSESENRKPAEFHADRLVSKLCFMFVSGRASEPSDSGGSSSKCCWTNGSIPFLFFMLRFLCFLMQIAFYSGQGGGAGGALEKWNQARGGFVLAQWISILLRGNLKGLFQTLLGLLASLPPPRPPPPPPPPPTPTPAESRFCLIKGRRRSEKSRICSASWHVKEERCFNGGWKTSLSFLCTITTQSRGALWVIDSVCWWCIKHWRNHEINQKHVQSNKHTCGEHSNSLWIH